MIDINKTMFHGYINHTGISTSMEVLLETIERFIDLDYLYFSISFKKRSTSNVHIIFDYCPKLEKLDVRKEYVFSDKLRDVFHERTIPVHGASVLIMSDIRRILSPCPEALEEYLRFDPIFNSAMTMELIHVPGEFLLRLGIRSLAAGAYSVPEAEKLCAFLIPAREIAESILSRRGELIWNAEEMQQFSPKSKKEMFRQCKGLAFLQESVALVGMTDSNVLILGETGTGKDILAEAIHEQSPFLAGPFVNANCGALYDNLLDAELFGYERGAFTGAYNQHKGLFEQANGGTLFLNEIGELSLAAQSKLLTVLETRTVCRMGSHHPVSLRFRLICATNRDLPHMVHERAFREDLWYRINTFQMVIPPLRERKEDIVTLAEYYCSMYASSLKMGYTPALSPMLKLQMLEYPWNGNIRELRSWIERACLKTKWLGARYLVMPDKQLYSLQDVPPQDKSRLGAVEKAHIEACLLKCNGKIQGKHSAAEMMGINGSTLRARMRKLGIPFPGRNEK